MPRPPHKLALFSLRPLPDNEQAKNAVSHPDNLHHVSVAPDGQEALDVGFHIRGKSSTTLATLGRGVEADLFIGGSSIAKIQCSFEIDLETGLVMLYDRSHGCTTQVFGENAMQFEHGRIRKVLVQQGLNTIIGMGGEGRNLVQFKLEWYQNPVQTADAIKEYDAFPCGRLENPRFARTIEEVPTELPSRRETRPHTTAHLKMRHVTVGPPLGSGQFGTVYKAIDVDSGKLMAVKIVGRPQKVAQQEAWRRILKREVEILCNINHPHITSYIASQGWGEPHLMIFTALMQGTLEALVEGGADKTVVADSVCPQILRAIDHTAWKGIIHRDVKPENILYELNASGQYLFQLTDFGLSNHAVDARTFAGSKLYMAPEMFMVTNQSTKVDVWSLFVTMLWVVDPEFRQREFRSDREVLEVISLAASRHPMRNIQDMAIGDPVRRASAAQMLVKCYDGEGLSTPRNQVPALASSAPRRVAGARAPTPAPLRLPARAPQINWTDFRTDTNTIQTTTQRRGERANDLSPRNPFAGFT